MKNKNYVLCLTAVGSGFGRYRSSRTVTYSDKSLRKLCLLLNKILKRKKVDYYWGYAHIMFYSGETVLFFKIS